MRDDVLDQAYIHRHRSKKPLAGNKELTGAPGSDTRNHERGNDGWNDSQFHFGKTELHRFDSNADIARRNQSGTPAECRAMNAGDHGLGALRNGKVHLSYGSGVRKVLLVRVLNHALHPVKICAGTERLTIAGEDNDAHFITPAELGEGLGHLPREFIIKCVMDFRAVQNDKSDTLVNIDLQHGSYIRNTPNRVSSCGAFLAAEIPRPRTIRVSKGSMTPSSQRRAVLKYALLSSAYLSSVGFMNSCCSAAVIVLP